MIINNSVIIGDATGAILIVDKDSGKILKEEKVAESNIRRGLSSDGEYIYSTFVEGIVTCLDINGNLIWKATDDSDKTSGNIRSSVAIVNGFIYYGSPYSNALTKLNLEDGILVDEYPMGKNTDPHWSSPVVANNMLYLGRHDGSFNAFDIKSNDLVWQLFIGGHKNTNKPKNKHTDWWNPENGSVYATPSIDVDGTIYIGSGEGWLYAIDHKK